MKVGPQSYRGIDFVREADLPADQQAALGKTPNNPERIKILINGSIVENCIYYKDYERWYNETFGNEAPVISMVSRSVEPVSVSVSQG
ncbi:MAG: hypothetical protein N2044_03615 [Cyclobacteriaceae bacterium]|nr:hypothetical protein [Cyclobacteriaceae bacterium]MCX7636915.1 hypothetical protein [Cyclobacteriaceae bacterium]MDW8330388.1 hypothetical protein [Cyclobacteriaceae bacterium]